MGGRPRARYARAELADRDAASSTASYAQALAALILDADADAQVWAERMGAGNEAFVRTAEAIAALAAHDADGYAAALSAIVRDFEQRTRSPDRRGDRGHRADPPARRRRGMAAAIESPVLAGGASRAHTFLTGNPAGVRYRRRRGDLIGEAPANQERLT